MILNLSPDNSVYEGNTANIDLGVDFQENERVPITSLKVVVKAGDYQETCTFTPTGVKESCSSDFGSVSALELRGYGSPSDENWAKASGFGYDGNTYVQGDYNMTFGTIDGYGYMSGLSKSELQYRLHWDAPEVSSDTNYNVELYVIGEGGSNNFTYVETGKTITVNNIEEETEEDDSSTSRRPNWDSAPSIPSAKARHLDVSVGQTIGLEVSEEAIAMTNVKAVVAESSSAVEMNVKKAENPGTEPSKKVYQYMDVNVDADVEKVDFEFRVKRSWLTDNGLGEDEVSLYHNKDNSWQEVPTEFVSSDDDYVYYTAEVKSLSTFAVGEKKQEETSPTSEQETEGGEDSKEQVDISSNNKQPEQEEEISEQSNQQEEQETTPEKEGKGMLWLVFLGIIIIGGLVFYFVSKRQ